MSYVDRWCDDELTVCSGLLGHSADCEENEIEWECDKETGQIHAHRNSPPHACKSVSHVNLLLYR